MNMDTKIIYFAYGSNINTEHLRSYVPSAKAIGRARLLKKRMMCNKKSRDNSSKANLVDSRGDAVWGVLYEIDIAELDKLDRAEGGYERTTLQVLTDQGDAVTAEVYTSTRVTTDPTPYDWYKELILKGAREHQLPGDYLEYLEQLPSKTDPRKRGRNFI